MYNVIMELAAADNKGYALTFTDSADSIIAAIEENLDILLGVITVEKALFHLGYNLETPINVLPLPYEPTDLTLSISVNYAYKDLEGIEYNVVESLIKGGDINAGDIETGIRAIRERTEYEYNRAKDNGYGIKRYIYKLA